MTIEDFKKDLSLVFDDNTKTVVYKNYLDYSIWFLIFLSTAEIYLSTFPGIVEKYGTILNIIDHFTTLVFTIEIALRIWTIDLLEEKYKGIWGRIKYCFSFYGFIDIMSTYTIYINMIPGIKLPIDTMKVLRVFRLLRIFRFMRSFRLLSAAISNKSKELFVSLQFLIIITVILSFALFFIEHDAQPDVYTDGSVPVLWAFMQYIGDPGSLAENYPPVTMLGKIVACIIGVLGIAIFAVPAGLIGSGFTEEIENEAKKQKTKKNVEKLHLAFQRKLDRFTRFQIAPQFVSIGDIQARLRMNLDDIFDGIDNSNQFRLVNLSATRTVDERADDKLAVEHYPVNRSYGCCINRGSKVTIVSPASLVDPGMYHFAYYLAKLGGFNLISREIGVLRPYVSFYLVSDESKKEEGFQDYMNDLNRLANSEDHYVITILAASGANEPNYPTQMHFSYGGKRGDETYDDPNITIHNVPLFDKMYTELTERLESELNIKSDRQRYHDTSNPKFYCRHLEHSDKVNGIAIRIAWSECLWNPAHVQLSQIMAEAFNKHFDGDKEILKSPELKMKGDGYNDYKDNIDEM